MGKRWKIAAAAGLFALAVVSLLIFCSINRPALFNKLDLLAYDLFTRARGPVPVHPAPVIIDIDEASLRRIGQWPWPRYLLAELVAKAAQAGVSAIGLDIILSEPDRSSPQRIRQQLAERYNLDVTLEGVPQELQNNDALLAQILAQAPAVLAAFALPDDAEPLPKTMPRAPGLAEKAPENAPNPRDTVMRAPSLLLPLPELYQKTPIGIVNSNLDMDGVVRSVPMLMRAGNRVYPSLSLRLLMRAQKVNSLRLASSDQGLEEVAAGKIRIPVRRDGTFMPVFHGPRCSYPYYSAHKVLSGEVGEQELKGRIALVGSSALGLLDSRATPFDPLTPGVEVHATVLDNMLSGDSQRELPQGPGLQVMGIAAAGLGCTALFLLTPSLIYGPLALALMGGWLWAAWHWFLQGLFFSPVYIVATVLLAAAGILPARYWLGERRRKSLQRTFGRFVSSDVVKRMVAQGDMPLAGEQKEMTVLFTDIRNFTSISEKMLPEQLIAMLNHYFTPMTACVKKHDGTMDKYIGDALMAFWNAPLTVPDHALKAVLAGVEMQQRLDELRPEILRDYGVELHMGVGIHTGLTHVGNVGSAELLNYTCIGDTVNQAARLEGLCKQYGAGIVVSADTATACGDAFRFRYLDRICVKGRSQPVDICCPLDASAFVAERETLWAEALALYLKGAFAEAATAFASLSASHAELATPCTLFLERCRALNANPPAGWDGVWTYDSK